MSLCPHAHLIPCQLGAGPACPRCCLHELVCPTTPTHRTNGRPSTFATLNHPDHQPLRPLTATIHHSNAPHERPPQHARHAARQAGLAHARGTCRVSVRVRVQVQVKVRLGSQHTRHAKCQAGLAHARGACRVRVRFRVRVQVLGFRLGLPAHPPRTGPAGTRPRRSSMSAWSGELQW